MHQLARVKLTDQEGRELSLRAVDIRHVLEATGGSVVTCDGPPGAGVVSSYRVSETVTAIHNAIDALWDEYTVALGNP